MTDKDWSRLCGYVPDKAQKAIALAAVRDEKISLAESCSRMSLPPIFIEGINEPDSDVYDNPFRPAVYIKSRNNNYE